MSGKHVLNSEAAHFSVHASQCLRDKLVVDLCVNLRTVHKAPDATRSKTLVLYGRRLLRAHTGKEGSSTELAAVTG